MRGRCCGCAYAEPSLTFTIKWCSHNFICVMFSSQNPHIVLERTNFTVGQGRQCDLSVRDPKISKSLCKLKHMESEVNCSVDVSLC